MIRPSAPYDPTHIFWFDIPIIAYIAVVSLIGLIKLLGNIDKQEAHTHERRTHLRRMFL